MTAITAEHSGTFSIGGDILVHRLGFGAMRITGGGVWGPPRDRREAIATLGRAVDLGVTLIDTADSYGPSVSEELIAQALHPYRSGVIVATKGGYERPGPDQWRVNCRPEHLAAALDGSLHRLRLDRIDLYQLHRIDPAVPEADQFGFLQRAIEQGRIRHVGLSEVGIDAIARARTFFPVASVQNRYSLADRGWDAAVDYCTRERIAFMPWAPLQGAGEAGTLIGRYARAAKRAFGGDPIARVARRHGATPPQIAIAWLLARSPVMLPIPGTSGIAHLEENVAAAGVALTAEDIAELAGPA